MDTSQVKMDIWKIFSEVYEVYGAEGPLSNQHKTLIDRMAEYVVNRRIEEVIQPEKFRPKKRGRGRPRKVFV